MHKNSMIIWGSMYGGHFQTLSTRVYLSPWKQLLRAMSTVRICLSHKTTTKSTAVVVLDRDFRFSVHWHQSIYAVIYLSAWKQLLHAMRIAVHVRVRRWLSHRKQSNCGIGRIWSPQSFTRPDNCVWEGLLGCSLFHCQSTSFFFSFFFLSHKIANGKQICSFGIPFLFTF